MGSLLQDLRYGLRMLGKSPGFTAVALISLALGIGANVTIFTLLNAVFLRQIPVQDIGSLVSLFTTDAKNTGRFLDFMPMSVPNFRDFHDQGEVFSSLVASTGVPVSITGGTGDPEQIFGQLVSGSYFDTLGVKLPVGRGFLSEEDSAPGAHPVAVLSHRFWQRRFASDTSLIGGTVRLNGRVYTIVGIAPLGFRGTAAFGGPDVWIPLMQHGDFLPRDDWFDSRRALLVNVLGRLKPGVTPGQAASSLKTIAARLEKDYPNDNLKRSVNLVPLAQSVIDPNQRDVFVRAGALLMTVVSLVLLIACANLANLLLARATARRREVAIRLSLGAGRGRLIRQLLTESILLAFLGGAAGLATAVWGRDLLWKFRPPFFAPGDLDLQLDGRVLLFTLALALLTGLLFGLVPALHGSRPDLASDLKERTSQQGQPNRRFSARRALVMSQVALSLVALIGSGLFLRSLASAQRIDPGFDVERLAVLNVNVAGQGYEQPRGKEFYRLLIERVSSVPGVEATALSSLPPFALGFLRSVFPEGLEASPDRSGILVPLNTVSTGYFRVAGIPILRGRDFAPSDRDGAPHVAIINETMAKRFWPGDDPLGKRFHFHGEDFWHEVIGLAKDSKYLTVGEDPTPFLYLPLDQHYEPALTVFARARRAPESILPTLRAEVQSLDRNMPLTGVDTARDLLSQGVWPARMGASLLATFGGLALLLAAVGIYGVTTYSVSQRTQEIGIRMAMGASPRDVLRLILRQGMVPVLLGVAAGLAAAAVLSRLVSGLLLGVSSTDPVTFTVVPAMLAAVALLANYLPARRATRVDPAVTLRCE